MRIALIVTAVLSAAVLQAASLNAPAPAFTLKDSQNHTRTLAELNGQVVFINFWASWCGPCQAELPELNKLANRYAGRKVRFLAINVEQTRAPAKALLARLGLSHPAFNLLWDSSSKVVSRYNVQAMPSSFVVDARGVVRYIHTGYHPDNPASWQREIDQLLAMPKRPA